MRYFLALFLLVAQPALAVDVTAQINGLRAQRGLGPVKISRKLEQAAKVHAADMERRNYFSHTGKNGSSAGQRAKRAGYRWCIVAENIAKGQKSVPQVMRDWITSRSHYKNMMLPQIKEYGVARVGNSWVMVLGARRC